jgi:hypothetical protein
MPSSTARWPGDHSVPAAALLSQPSAGRLPKEVGLQRATSGADDRSAHAYREAGTREAVAVLLITNVDEIDDLNAAARSRAGERAAVVRWRSTEDNATLRHTARGLGAPDGLLLRWSASARRAAR